MSCDPVHFVQRSGGNLGHLSRQGYYPNVQNSHSVVHADQHVLVLEQRPELLQG